MKRLDKILEIIGWVSFIPLAVGLFWFNFFSDHEINSMPFIMMMVSLAVILLSVIGMYIVGVIRYKN